MKIENAVIVQFPHNGEFGFALIPETGEKMFLPLSGFSGVEVREDAIFFTEEQPNRLPGRDDLIVLVRDRRPPVQGKCWRASLWAYRCHWEDAERKLARDRRVFRVMAYDHTINGVPTEATLEEIVVGTLAEIQRQFPRREDGDRRDRCGGIYTAEVGGSQYSSRNCWEEQIGGPDSDKWEPCKDQRSKPIRVKSREDYETDSAPEERVPGQVADASGRSLDGLLQFTSGMQGEGNEELIALAASAGGRRSGTHTPRPG